MRRKSIAGRAITAHSDIVTKQECWLAPAYFYSARDLIGSQTIEGITGRVVTCLTGANWIPNWDSTPL
jgi:hypothetical protein